MTQGTSALLLIALSAGATPSEVKVEDLGTGQFRLSVTVENSTDPTVAQEALVPVATRLCGESVPRFGKHRFESYEALSGRAATAPTITFVQMIDCASQENALATNPGVPPAPAEPPNMQDEATVRARTLAYLTAKDSGHFDVAMKMVSPGALEFMTVGAWRTTREDFNRSVRGEPRRQVLRITWYDDPQGAPPGRYAAADYMANYADGALYCGYVMWQRQADGAYLLMREEEGTLKSDIAAKLDPAKRQTTLRTLGCRD